MANFKTHVNTAIITSGLTATALLSAQHITFSGAIWLWFLGSIGGLLPDIDSDNSTSLDTIFGIFTLSIVLITVHFISSSFFQDARFIELVVSTIVVYGIMRLIVRPLFEHLTIHRGSCHSILFLVFIAILTTQFTWKITENHIPKSDLIAWLSGGFILLGGITHLLLDEMYSVDLQNATIKRSFGTAIKLADFRNKTLTLVMTLTTGALIYLAPDTENTIISLTDWSKFNF